MARRERNYLIAPADKKSACADDERIGPLPHKARKCHVDVTRSAGIQHNKLQPKSTRGRLHLAHKTRRFRRVQVHEQSDDGRIGYEFVQQRELLRRQFDTEPAHSGDALARPIEARIAFLLTWSYPCSSGCGLAIYEAVRPVAAAETRLSAQHGPR